MKNTLFILLVSALISALSFSCDDSSSQQRNRTPANKQVNSGNTVVGQTGTTTNPITTSTTTTTTLNPTEPLFSEQFSDTHLPYYQMFKETLDTNCLSSSDQMQKNLYFEPWPDELKKFLSIELSHFPLWHLFDKSKFYGILLTNEPNSNVGGAAQFCNMMEYRFITINKAGFIDNIFQSGAILSLDKNSGINESLLFGVLLFVHEFSHIIDDQAYGVESLDLYLQFNNSLSALASQRFSQRKAMIDLSWIITKGYSQNTISPKFSSTSDYNQNFVSEYARTNFVEDFAETVSTYYVETRYNAGLPESLNTQPIKQKMCSVIDSYYKTSGGTNEDCQQCLSGACALAHSPLYKTRSIRDSLNLVDYDRYANIER